MSVDLVIPLAIFVVVGVVVAVGVFLVVRSRTGAAVALSLRTVLLGYFYLMALVSFLFLAVGLTSLLNAGLGEAFGRSFSFFVPGENMPLAPLRGPASTPMSPDEIREQERRRVEQEFRDGLVHGATATVLGAVLWPLHAWGRRRLSGAEDSLNAFLDRVFLVIPLVLFSLIGLISLVMAIFQLASFLIVPARGAAFQTPPGAAIATAVVFVPLWVYYLRRASRQGERPAASEGLLKAA